MMKCCGTLWKKEISDDDARKWAPIIMLGPLPVVIYCFFVVIFGQLVIHLTRTSSTTEGTFPGWACSSNDDFSTAMDLVYAFYALNICVSYMILMTFCWSFLGYRVEFDINYFFNKKGTTPKMIPLMVPFTQLRWLAAMYIFLFIFHFVVIIIGTLATGLAAPCREENLGILAFSSFMAVMYWILFSLVISNTCGKLFGKQVEKKLIETANKATAANAEHDFIRKQFKKFAGDGEDDEIDADELGALLVALKMPCGEEEVEMIRGQLDADGSGTINLEEFLTWYDEGNESEGKKGKKNNKKGQRGDSSDDDDDDESSSGQESDSD